jgi:hypothetical protein
LRERERGEKETKRERDIEIVFAFASRLAALLVPSDYQTTFIARRFIFDGPLFFNAESHRADRLARFRANNGEVREKQAPTCSERPACSAGKLWAGSLL